MPSNLDTAERVATPVSSTKHTRASRPAVMPQGLALTLTIATLALAACAGGSLTPPDALAQAEARAVAAEAKADAAAAACPAPHPTEPLACSAIRSTEPLTRLLAYADKVRLLAPADLSIEITRLGDSGTPENQIQQALALSQLRQLPELVRAQELLARVLGNNSPDAQAYHAMARLLAARFGDQRRADEQVEKQNQQVRDIQRRLDQTNDRLEALKAIERSLSRQPAASAPVQPGQPAARRTP